MCGFVSLHILRRSSYATHHSASAHAARHAAPSSVTKSRSPPEPTAVRHTPSPSESQNQLGGGGRDGGRAGGWVTSHVYGPSTVQEEALEAEAGLNLQRLNVTDVAEFGPPCTLPQFR